MFFSLLNGGSSKSKPPAAGVTYDRYRRNGPTSKRDHSDLLRRRIFESHGAEAAVLGPGRRSELQALPELAAGGGVEQCGAVEDGAGAVLQLHQSLHHRRAVPARSPIHRRPDSDLRRRDSGRRRRI